MAPSWRPSAGDPTAAEDLVAAYGDRSCRLATRITGNAQDAEEAVQDAFLSVIRKIDTFRGDSAFGSWLYRIVANAGYQRCRRRRGRAADVSLDKLLPEFDAHGRHVAPVADWSMSVDDPARQTELRMVLTTAIDELPPITAPSCCSATSRGFHSRKPLRPSALPSSTSSRVCIARGSS
jgi:RNA polymerase sigma-70 factor (ECF subfamily)